MDGLGWFGYRFLSWSCTAEIHLIEGIPHDPLSNAPGPPLDTPTRAWKYALPLRLPSSAGSRLESPGFSRGFHAIQIPWVSPSKYGFEASEKKKGECFRAPMGPFSVVLLQGTCIQQCDFAWVMFVTRSSALRTAMNSPQTNSPQ